jgi:two-component system, NtrC family, sensor kinase
MRVRAKVTVLLALLFTALIAAQWAIQQSLLLPRFEELERQSARTDMQRFELAVERELQSLSASANDWGNWADTWDYMKRPNRPFEQANLNDEALRTLKVDYIALVANDGRFVWTGGLDPLSGERLEIRLNADNHLEPAWTRVLGNGLTTSGLIDTSAGVMLASGAPILDGMNHGPSRGMVIVGRLFDEAEKVRIGTQAQVSLKLDRWRADSDAQRASGDAVSGGDTRLRVTPKTIDVEHVLRDLSGRALLTASIAVPRKISGQGAKAVRYSTLSVSVAAAVVLAVLIYLIGRIVVGPLAAVTDHAERIAAADDLSVRLDSTRRDELGTLAASIDHMVERLAQSRRELIDRSFESGAAENASGVLHELGNAMTPLAVHAETAAEQVEAMPVDDLLRGVEELFVDAPEAPRRQDLQSYLRLVAVELERLHARAGESLRAVLAQAEKMRAALQAQRSRPRAGAVMESTTPAELVARGLDRLTALQRARLDIETSPNLAGVGAMTLPCTTLAMVLQKLAQYAADAAHRAGLARARLRISAHQRGSEGAGKLRLIVETNAGGIAPADSAALFRKPDAAQSLATSMIALVAGADLHWCANTLHALGGSIAAHSDGPGTGIRFEILVPVGEAHATSAGRAA